MDKAFIGGFALGLFMVAMVVYLLRKAGKSGPCKYDERQELQRGRAFKYGFFTLLIYDLLMGAVYSGGWPGWCDMFVFQCIGVGIALMVFISCCIWKDAYISLTEQPKKVCVLLVAAVLVNVAGGVMNAVNRQVFTENALNFGAVNFIFAAVLLVVLVEFLLKLWLDQKRAE